jgi:hypothetical protein
MIANYEEKAKSTTTEGVKLLEGRAAEPEIKKTTSRSIRRRQRDRRRREGHDGIVIKNNIVE